jgi:hypothetical protein
MHTYTHTHTLTLCICKRCQSITSYNSLWRWSVTLPTLLLDVPRRSRNSKLHLDHQGYKVISQELFWTDEHRRFCQKLGKSGLLVVPLELTGLSIGELIKSGKLCLLMKIWVSSWHCWPLRAAASHRPSWPFSTAHWLAFLFLVQLSV